MQEDIEMVMCAKYWKILVERLSKAELSGMFVDYEAIVVQTGEDFYKEATEILKGCNNG